ncbi:EAL domain-containing protein [Baaleninema simplex]|uniref:EAL domain-containing protein n=1 Tax=Baaleninema simplex TaxID=2862350 RepID=UPI000344E030|nr:EAL domain-containing protein [Baaleninema simplex]
MPRHAEPREASPKTADPLASTETWLKAILDRTFDGIFVLDVRESVAGTNYVLIEANPALNQMLLLEEDAVDRSIDIFFPEPVATVTQERCDRCRDKQQTVSYEVTWQRYGQPTTLLVSLSPIFDRHGCVGQIVGLCHDTSERRRVLQEARLLQTITLAMVESRDFAAALGVALRKICQVTTWDYGEVWLPTPDGQRLEGRSAWYSNSNPNSDNYQQDWHFRQLGQGLTFPSEALWYGQVWSVNNPDSRTETSLDPALDLLRVDSAIAHGFSAGLAMPLLVKGEVLGVFVFFVRQSQQADPQKISLVSAITVQLSVVLHHKKYRNIFENAVSGIYQKTLDGRYTMANPMLASIFGYSDVDEFVEAANRPNFKLYVNDSDLATFLQQVRDRLEGSSLETQIYRRDGSTIWIRETARTVGDCEKRPIAIEGTVEDITVRKQAELKLRQRDALLQGTSRALQTLIARGNRANVIPEALSIIGETTGVDRISVYEYTDTQFTPPTVTLRYEWHNDNLTSRHHRLSSQDGRGDDGDFPLLPEYYQVLDSGQHVHRTLNQTPEPVRSSLAAENIAVFLLLPIVIEDEHWGYLSWECVRSQLLDSDSEISILQAVAASLGGTIQHQRTAEIVQYRAFHDLLTGLPNRLLFDEHLHTALARAKRNGEKVAVCFLDLDQFKIINDTLGHAIGDKLLQQTSQRLRSCLRQFDVVARWGGDEFILLLPQIRHIQDAEKIAHRLLKVLENPFEIDGHQLYVSTSIGIALYPTDHEDAETLVKQADIALYRAKDAGRNNYQLYTPSMEAQTSKRRSAIESLRKALEQKELRLYYQPQMTAEGAIAAWEALVRWQHPTQGLLLPSQFLPIAEENGSIAAIGEWVLERVCRQIQRWNAANLGTVKISANLSTYELQNPNLSRCLEELLQQTRIDPSQLELEIPETVALQDTKSVRERVMQFQKMGISIALDDFGTGYASLSSLPIFPIQTLKIHQNFVRTLGEDSYNEAAIAAIVALGNALDLRIVAEGVETQLQCDRLRHLDCPQMQGYFFGHPMSAEEATQLMLRR